jgi:single-strand DNA-binding protein
MSDLRLPSINRVALAGRLTHEPQLNYTQKGKAVLRMRVALNRPYKDSQGEWQQEASFLTVVAWDKLAETCAEHLSRGSAIYAEGRLKSQEREDPEGKIRASLDVQADSVQFLDKVGSNGSEEEAEEAQPEGKPPF